MLKKSSEQVQSTDDYIKEVLINQYQKTNSAPTPVEKESYVAGLTHWITQHILND